MARWRAIAIVIAIVDVIGTLDIVVMAVPVVVGILVDIAGAAAVADVDAAAVGIAVGRDDKFVVQDQVYHHPWASMMPVNWKRCTMKLNFGLDNS